MASSMTTIVMATVGSIIGATLMMNGLGSTGGTTVTKSAETTVTSGDGVWRSDPIWYAGKAEYSVYEATRPIYGSTRTFDAVAIINKQIMDPKTGTKTSDWERKNQTEVFKQNVREVIPTDNYDYKYLTTSFIRTDTLDAWKMTMSSQEDCGATFKEYRRNGKYINGLQMSYFPDEGHQQKRISAPNGRFQFQDALSLTLRDYDFDAATHPEMTLQLLPDQTHTHLTSMDAVDAVVTYEGLESLALPIGEIDAHHLKVDAGDVGGISEYWFAADGGSDWLHVMVQYQGPYGVTYHMKSHQWWAYWER